MKRFAMVAVLMCALSSTIFAGNMPTVGVVDTPPPPPATNMMIAGNMPTGGFGDTPPLPATNTLLVSMVLTVLTLT